jgi:hypothetical protein
LIWAPGSGSAEAPAPLSGVPLAKTGLRLLVADKPPFVLDVDSGRVTSVDGIRGVELGTVGVVGVAGRAGVLIVRSAPDANLYSVRGRDAWVSYLGTGRTVTPAADGQAVWVHGRVGRSSCTLRHVGLDGRRLRVARPFPCRTSSDPPGGALGVVVGRTRVLDPVTGRTVLRTRLGVLAAAGDKLVLAGPGRQFTLLDAQTRAERRLPWPSTVPSLGSRAAVDPRGRFVALSFGQPSYGMHGQQVLDVWLLDAETGELTQLPGMPAFVRLKFTGLAWTDDGRLVLLGENQKRAFVAVWRPGQRRLALKTVAAPEHTGQFAPLR